MDARVLAAGDAGWLIELPERIDPDVNARAIQIARAVQSAKLPVNDIVVGYRSVMVYIEPLSDQADTVEGALRDIAASAPLQEAVTGPLLKVPVCYDGPHGPDLAEVAAAHGRY